MAAASDAFSAAATRPGFVAAIFVVTKFIISLQLPDLRYADAEKEPDG